MSADEAGYRILDEPRPGAMARFAVDPIWPMFGMMFAGAWFAYLWFAFNGFAVGSPTRRKELVIAIVGLVGLVAVPSLVILLLVNLGMASTENARYGGVVVACWKVGVTYALYFLQIRSFELYEYYGGVLRSGMIAVVGGFLLTRALSDAAAGNFFLRVLFG
jgi:hypothetical protein